MADFDTNNDNIDQTTDQQDQQPGQSPKKKPLGVDAQTLADTLQKSRSYVDKLEDIANDPQYARGAPPETQSTLQQAIADAKDLYERRASQNEWLEVAQNLGRAVTQFGAAQAGLHTGGRGANMANIDMGQPVDYNARTERAFREYQQDIKNAENSAGAERQSWLDSAAQKKDEYDKLAGAYKEGASVYDTQARTLAGELAANARAARAEKAQSAREARQLRQMNAQELDRQEKSLVEQIRNGQELANELQSEGDLSSKSADKLKEKYGAVAAKAGVDLPAAMQQYSANAPTRKREIFGMGIPGTSTTDTANPQNKQSLYDALGLTDKLQQLQDVRAKKQKLLAGGQSTTSAAPTTTEVTPLAGESPATAPASKTVMIKGPSGEVAEMTPHKAQKYLSKPGYTQIK